MKKLFGLILMFATVTTLVACGNGERSENLIAVISREQGSGTRNAMEEMVDINTSVDNKMVASAIIRDGNGVVATQVMGNRGAIGYVSFATVEANPDRLRGLYINGVAPTAENVLDGLYEVSRDFDMIFPTGELDEVQTAFVTFMKSIQGLEALRSADTIVDLSGAENFDMTAHMGISGTLTLGGSTSTERAVMAVAKQFMAMFPQVVVTYSAVGSGAGIQGAQDGRFNIGFTSRSVLDSELTDGFQSVTICRDGIVFVVHPDNFVTDLTLEQIRDIYMGNIVSWDEVK